MKIYKQKLIFIIIISIILLYGSLSSATPNKITGIETLMAALMIAALLLSLSQKIIANHNYAIYLIHLIFLATGTFIGLALGNGYDTIFRDIIPWAYFLLILRLLASHRPDNISYNHINYLTLSAYISGAGFTIRHFLDPSNQSSEISEIGTTAFTTSGEYYLIEPLVLFFGLYSLFRVLTENKLHIKLIFIIPLLLFLTAAASQVLRGYFLACFLLTITLLIQKKISKSTFIFFTTSATIISIFNTDFTFEQVSQSYDLLIQKQINVGSNSRIEEISTILQNASTSIEFFLLGTGFGGSLDFGYGIFRYTHNYVTYIVMKFGVILSLFYITSIILVLRFNLMKNVVFITFNHPTSLCAFFSVLYFIGIQPGYKMLGLYVLVYTIGIIVFQSSNSFEKDRHAEKKKSNRIT